MTNKLSLTLQTALIVAFLAIGIAGADWRGPGGDPPTNNAPAPINASSITQQKDGGLVVAGDGTGDGFGVASGNLVVNLGDILVNAGKIGVGLSAAPDADLDVAGQVKIRGGTPGVDRILVSDADGLASWKLLSDIGGSLPPGSGGGGGVWTKIADVSTSSRTPVDVPSVCIDGICDLAIVKKTSPSNPSDMSMARYTQRSGSNVWSVATVDLSGSRSGGGTNGDSNSIEISRAGGGSCRLTDDDTTASEISSDKWTLFVGGANPHCELWIEGGGSGGSGGPPAGPVPGPFNALLGTNIPDYIGEFNDGPFAIDMPSTTTVYVGTTVGYSSGTTQIVYYTHDGGLTWFKGPNLGGGAVSAIGGIDAVNNTTAYAVVDGGAIFVTRTVDGGETWAKTSLTSISNTSGSSSRTRGLHVDGLTIYVSYYKLVSCGFACSKPEFNVAKSTNGGTTWLSTPIHTYLAAGGTYGGTDIYVNGGVITTVFTDNTNPSSLYISRSLDGGATWTIPQIVGVLDKQLASGPYIDGSGSTLYITYASGGFNNFVKSTDNGLTWSAPSQIVGTSTGNVYSPSLKVVDANNAVIGYKSNTGNLRIANTADGGTSWAHEPVLTQRGANHPPQIGWFGGQFFAAYGYPITGSPTSAPLKVLKF